MTDQLTPAQDADWLGKVFDAFLTPVLPDVFGVTPQHIVSAGQSAEAVGASAGQAIVDAPAAIGRAVGGAVDDAARAASATAWQLAAWGGVAALAYLWVRRLERG